MIIGIAGPTASGKTTIAKLLQQKLDAERMRYSEILAEIATERGLDPTDKATLQEMYLSERQEKGEDFLAREMETRVLLSNKAHFIIEGNRRLVDIDALRDIAQKKGEILFLLFIDAPTDLRFSRYNSRLKLNGEEPISREAFENLERNAAEDEINDLREIFSREGVAVDSGRETPEEIFKVIEKFLK